LLVVVVAVVVGVVFGVFCSASSANVSTWADLEQGISNCEGKIDRKICKKKCTFVLARDFLTPTEGLTTITTHGGQDISIDGKGLAVLDAHGKQLRRDYPDFFQLSNDGNLRITGVVMQNSTYGSYISTGRGHLELMGCTFKSPRANVSDAVVTVPYNRPTYAYLYIDYISSYIYSDVSSLDPLTALLHRQTLPPWMSSPRPAVTVDYGTATMTSCTFDGGGVFLSSAVTAMASCNFNNGSGVNIRSGSATITSCTFENVSEAGSDRKGVCTLAVL
jgi:hypothetical protein